ncbi:hypothetical protein [Allonocardiopsis opalescens]|uniref:Uncharacterized protein n=1 Tax=Allonocardiopsis opalescens TaxID=1144618 RepID=A0A2T0Q799_9ACTN|nr:hypothetical protein [Allonocardiopsis opalescens]PRX99706.1 hypothetical protein CLV72_103311 [Allonocardiopsis opalescens]
MLTEEREGPRLLLLGGRSWRVTYVDWTRRRAFVEPAEGGGVARWTGAGAAGLSFELTRAMREALLGADPPVRLTHRAGTALAALRAERGAPTAHPGGTLVTREGEDVRWWTWAGFRANATLTASLSAVADPVQRPTDLAVRLRPDLTAASWAAARQAVAADGPLVLPDVDPRAVHGLKFAAVLPERLAAATVAARLADFDGARRVLGEPVRLQIAR